MSDSPGLGTQLRRLLMLLDGDVQQIYDSLGVDFRPRFFPIMRALERDGDTTVGALAAMAGVSQPAITQTIRHMERAGLVRFGLGDDRRERHVGLTEDGIRLCGRLRPVWRAIAQAAEELDRSLPNSLQATVGAAIAQLEARPFASRIRFLMEE